MFSVFSFLIAAALASQGSILPEVFIFSFARFLFIILMLVLSVYFFVSMFFRKLAEINFFTLFGLSCGLLLFELIFNIYPGLIPLRLVNSFDAALRKNIVKAHGLGERGGYVGEEGGMYYFYPPMSKLSIQNNEDGINGFIQTDEQGFRNSVNHQKKVDLILLGDSLTLASGSPIDLGDLFREKGIKVLNLGMCMNAPQHWIDLFKRFGKKARPKDVVAFLYEGNDFNDANTYQSIFDAGKSYKEYLSEGVLQNAPLMKRDSFLNSILFVNHSYTLSLLKGVVQYRWFDFRGRITIADKITINGKCFEVGYLPDHITPGPKVTENTGFKLALSAIRNLNAECRKIGAKLWIVYLPTNSTVFAPYSDFPENRKRVNYHKTSSEKILYVCKKDGIAFLDPAGMFQGKIANTKIFLRNGKDTHLHPEGIKLLANFISKESGNFGKQKPDAEKK